MIEVSLTDARARLPELLTKAAEGEEVHIMRHGRRVGVLVGHDRWMKISRLDRLEEARALRRTLNEARERPLTPNTPWSELSPEEQARRDAYTEEWIAEVRRGRDKDAWDEAEQHHREWEEAQRRQPPEGTS